MCVSTSLYVLCVTLPVIQYSNTFTKLKVLVTKNDGTVLAIPQVVEYTCHAYICKGAGRFYTL